MLELVNVPVQLVAVNSNVLFEAEAIKSGCAERHRQGSGIVTLFKPGIYEVTFNADIAIPTGGTVDEIATALTIDGEVVGGSQTTVTPAAVEQYFNVSTTNLIKVYGNCGGSCCITVSARNVSEQPINVRNANLTVTRKC